MEKLNESRRNSLKMMAAAIGAVGMTSTVSKALADMCVRTPPQTEGPFYPVQDQLDKDTDLTRVKGLNGTATGQLIFIKGIVTDQHCEPVKGATVEIWQACASGKYNHPGDTDNPAPLDPNFQYWGIASTNEKGEYIFKTIKPGSYPAAPGWIRPPHVHYKAHKRGYIELTTQMYFAGEAYNVSDQILRRLSQEDQQSVIIDFQPAPMDQGFPPDSLLGVFNLSLEKV